MKCSQIKIALLTFLLGIISVPFFSQIYQKWSEPFVDVPQVVAETPIYVIVPTERNGLDNYWLRVGGSGGGANLDGCHYRLPPSGKQLNKKKR